MQLRHSLTLSQALFPQTGIVRDGLLVVAGSVLVALSAQIEIRLPFTPVPITGQTFGVLLVGALLGSRRGAAALLLYLLQGTMGLPVFAGGGFGLAHLAGPTGGYLVGFVAGGSLVGWLAEKGWDRRPATTLVAMGLGNGAIYLFGLAWLARFVPTDRLLLAGMLPFLHGDAIKLVLAALALPGGWAVLGRWRA
ncbi:MAG: biotin transporter BioY [Anaerolineae bacterium]